MSDDVHVSNEQRGGGSAFGELLRLQTEFQARLTEETLNYIRRLQGAAAPTAPGTVVVPQTESALTASASPGSTVELRLRIENRQRVYCVVTPMLSPLVSADGVTWFPDGAPSPPSTLLAPAQIRMLELRVSLPQDLPPGSYRGVLLLHGFGDGAVSVTIDAAEPAARRTATSGRGASRSRSRSTRKP